jgi:hypothetical protein
MVADALRGDAQDFQVDDAGGRLGDLLLCISRIAFVRRDRPDAAHLGNFEAVDLAEVLVVLNDLQRSRLERIVERRKELLADILGCLFKTLFVPQYDSERNDSNCDEYEADGFGVFVH